MTQPVEQLADDLRRSVQETPIPVLYVTHNRDEVFMLGERMLILVDIARLMADDGMAQIEQLAA